MSAENEGDRRECLACRGTGKLISGLGGTSHEVTCPWCEGSGRRIPGVDAQAHPAEGSPTAGAEREPAASAEREPKAGAESAGEGAGDNPA